MKLTNLTPNIISTSPSNFVGPVQPKIPESDLPFYRKLRRTDLTVSAIGIGDGGHISSEDTLYAFDHGINYFFYCRNLRSDVQLEGSSAATVIIPRGGITAFNPAISMKRS
jgi:hypothetical protein